MSTVIPEEIIRKKRDGLVLTEADIRAFVAGVADDSVDNEQIAALAMAIWFQGMNTAEQSALTLAIRDSGISLEWPDLDGPVVDKHSTGGVGDMVSFAVAPMVAACGGYVPMISGRSLGHTGGTLDKLESFPGINVMPELGRFQNWVRERGVAIIGQTAELAPADRRFYAVRGSTATVASRPLIVASILGKKLAEGLDGLVMDIKVGNGAFMRDPAKGVELATEISRVAASSGLRCTAVISDMNQPLAWTAGNAVEIREIIGYLGGKRRHPRLHEVVMRVAAEMLIIAGLAEHEQDAATKLNRALDSGAAAERFELLVAGQGGPAAPLERLARTLPEAAFVRPVQAPARGFVSAIDTRSLGLAVMVLGGGRQHTDDRIDPSVGLEQLPSVGDEVGPDRPLAVIHASGESAWEHARALVERAYSLAEARPERTPAVLGYYPGESNDEHG